MPSTDQLELLFDVQDSDASTDASESCTSNRSSSWSVLGIPFWIETPHFPFDPVLHFLVQFLG
ncbi:hypothetical protein, partial [Achromobacter xylosoxidans]